MTLFIHRFVSGFGLFYARLWLIIRQNCQSIICEKMPAKKVGERGRKWKTIDSFVILFIKLKLFIHILLLCQFWFFSFLFKFVIQFSLSKIDIAFAVVPYQMLHPYQFKWQRCKRKCQSDCNKTLMFRF